MQSTLAIARGSEIARPAKVAEYFRVKRSLRFEIGQKPPVANWHVPFGDFGDSRAQRRPLRITNQKLIITLGTYMYLTVLGSIHTVRHATYVARNEMKRSVLGDANREKNGKRQSNVIDSRQKENGNSIAGSLPLQILGRATHRRVASTRQISRLSLYHARSFVPLPYQAQPICFSIVRLSPVRIPAI